MGKCIYKPVGKAGEYAQWACNFFVGCSNDCDYCYCKKGVLGTVAGGKEAKLKKCFSDQTDAFQTFIKEATRHADELRHSDGLFFSFSSDPCLPETIDLTLMCASLAAGMDIRCQLLTKCAWWLKDENIMSALRQIKDHVSIGFTLTGMDEMERGRTVASNDDRLEAMQSLHAEGLRTFASFEPIIDVRKAMDVFTKSKGACDTYKFGLLSGKTDYDKTQLKQFADIVNDTCKETGATVYWKKSFLKLCEGPVSN